jgi:hypothetical protein
MVVNLQKVGGIAALIEALAYVVGFTVMATLLNPGNTETWGQAEKLAFVLEKKAIFQGLNLFIYVFFGVVLVVLAVALHERIKAKASALMQIATPFGLIWAGLVIASGMVASVGLEAVAKLHAQDATLAITAQTVIAAVQEGLGAVFGVGQIFWFAVIGVVMLRRNGAQAVVPAEVLA